MSLIGGAASGAAKKAGSKAASSAAKSAGKSAARGANSAAGKKLPGAAAKPAAAARKTAANSGGGGARPRPQTSSASQTARARFNAPKRPSLPGFTEQGREALGGAPRDDDGQKQSLTRNVGGLAKDVLGETAKSAAIGAATGGGLPGAAVGAAKGLAFGILKNKFGRRLLIGAAVVTVILLIAVPILVQLAIMQVSGSGLAAADSSTSVQAAVAVGADQKKVQEAADRSEATGVPWTVTVAYTLKAGKDVDPAALRRELDKADPAGDQRDLSAGAVYSSSASARSIGKSGDSKAAADAVKKVWVAALVGTGLDEATAGAVYDTALIFTLGQNNGCGVSSTPATGGASTGDTGSYSALQLANAQAIMGMAKTMFPGSDDVQRRAATIALQIAMQEHGLLNTLNEGDTKESATYVGLFQQISAFGTVEQRMDPAYATATFFNSVLRNNPTWVSMDQPALTLAMAHQQFGTGLPDSEYQGYANEVAARQPAAAALVSQYFTAAPALPMPAIKNPVAITGVTPTDGAPPTADCTTGPAKVNGTAQQIAQLLVQYEQQKKLTYWAGAPFPIDKQITNVANGTATASCQLAPAILGLIATAVQTFGTVQINDLNRRCSGENTNSAFSAHFYGNAVDFGAVGGHTTVGGDSWSVQLVKLADTVLPDGSGAGQVQCRGEIPGLNHIKRQFEDPCNHQHIDIGTKPASNIF